MASKMERRDFLRTAGLAATGALAGSAGARAEDPASGPPPNILFILVDELRFPSVFPAGITDVDGFLARFMPNLHGLWRKGVKFEPLAKLWRRSARFVASGGSASAIWRGCSDIAWYSAAAERFWVTSGQPMATLPRNGGKALMACLGANALR
jgi:hypothetical protein